MEEKDRDLDDLTADLKEKDIRIKELEIELLTANQNQLAGDGEHAQEMREMADKLDQCRVSERERVIKTVVQTSCSIYCTNFVVKKYEQIFCELPKAL